NYLKGNSVLANRAAMHLLAVGTQLSEDHLIRGGNLTDRYTIMTSSMFVFNDMVIAYEHIRDGLDAQTVDILDDVMMAICDKMCNYVGQGPTNQALFCMSLAIRMYNIFGIERYHDTFKRQITSLIDNVNNQHGQAELGYFLENYGCDASYEYMNHFHYYDLYKYYKKIPNSDKALLARMKASIEKSLEFQSFFWVPQPYTSSVVNIGPGNFTSRTYSTLGADNYPGYTMVWDEFPLARRRFEMNSGNKLVSTATTSYPHTINNEEWAIRQIQNYYSSYENVFNNGYGLGVWPGATYDAFNATEWVGPAENLPFEAENGTYWDKDGFIAFKSGGIYGVCFYGIDASSWGDSYSVMGGGPTLLWGEGTGTTLVSRKHYDYASGNLRASGSTPMIVDSADDIVSSCVYGTDNNGKFIYTGKEGTTWYSGLDSVNFEWIDEGKVFRIFGQVPDANTSYATGVKTLTDKTISWEYALEDTGVNLSVNLTSLASAEEFWLNIPIAAEDNNITYDYDADNNKLIVENGSGSMEYSWIDTQSVFIEKPLNGVRRLRLKLINQGGTGTAFISIKNNAPEYTLSEFGIYKDTAIGDTRLTASLKNNNVNQYISYWVHNSTDSDADATMYIAYFNQNGGLDELTSKDFTIAANGTTRLFSDPLDLSGRSGSVKAFVWSSDGRISPFVDKNEWNIVGG
ncbi:MAG: hypothetical protein WCX81_07120, partial [Monoglobales bacterium]